MEFVERRVAWSSESACSHPGLPLTEPISAYSLLVPLHRKTNDRFIAALTAGFKGQDGVARFSLGRHGRIMFGTSLLSLSLAAVWARQDSRSWGLLRLYLYLALDERFLSFAAFFAPVHSHGPLSKASRGLHQWQLW